MAGLGYGKLGMERMTLGKCVNNNDEMQTWTYYFYNILMTNRKTSSVARHMLCSCRD